MTVETAVAFPALVLLLAVALWGVSAAAAQVACVDAARAGARAAARGESLDEVRAAARRAAPPGAQVSITRDPRFIRVLVKAAVDPPVRHLFPQLRLRAQTVAATEPEEAGPAVSGPAVSGPGVSGPGVSGPGGSGSVFVMPAARRWQGVFHLHSAGLVLAGAGGGGLFSRGVYSGERILPSVDAYGNEVPPVVPALPGMMGCVSLSVRRRRATITKSKPEPKSPS